MNKATAPYPRVRWYNSLILRIMALCVILLLCLLGSVYEITRHYFREVVQEMETQTRDIANKLVLYFEKNPEAELHEAERSIVPNHTGTQVDLADADDEVTEVTPFMVEPGQYGRWTKVARVLLRTSGRQVLITARVEILPQTEIVRAFKNKYLLALTTLFVGTLGLMVYLIARVLRPLTDLTKACAQISGGKLEPLVTRRSSGEVRALEHTFNTMVASLQEKERIEANLRQAQRLSAIGNLAAGVAHDIRNPLNAIKLLSSHTIDTLERTPDAAPTVRSLQTIRAEVNRLEDIVSGFLSLARERELQPEPNRIDVVLEECVRLIRKDAEARGIRLITELRAGDTALLFDAKQMTRAVLNVLINAMEACPPGGRVRVFSRVSDQQCEIEVRDDGPGMPREVAERAFEPYYTTRPTGTGLGLPITRGIVEEHGGSVTLSSAENQGCQVLITLPLEMKVA